MWYRTDCTRVYCKLLVTGTEKKGKRSISLYQTHVLVIMNILTVEETCVHPRYKDNIIKLLINTAPSFPPRYLDNSNIKLVF